MSFSSDTIIDTAYKWLCKRRKDYHHNSDVWHLRFHWKTEKQKLIKELKEETFTFDCVEQIRTLDRTSYLWSARDALVLKALAIYLEEKLKPILSDRIFHLAGNKDSKKGSKAAIRKVYTALPEHNFVFRSDVAGYYASINHDILFEQIKRYIKEPFLLHLIESFLQHTIYDNGFYTIVLKGISLGCPLSPLLGALFLKPLDDAMSKTGLFYIRFMDDWIVLSPTRWKLRRAIAAVNKILNNLKLDKHSDKTFAGRISAGFDFLGYNFQAVESEREKETIAESIVNIPSVKQREKGTTLIREQTVTQTRNGMDKCVGKHINNKPVERQKVKKVFLRLAEKTINNFLQKVSRLYEQGADRFRIGKYVQRWCKWRIAGLQPGAQNIYGLPSCHIEVHDVLLVQACKVIYRYPFNPTS